MHCEKVGCETCKIVFVIYFFSFQIGFVDSPLLLQPINKGSMSKKIRHTARYLLSLCHALVVDEGSCKLDFPVVERKVINQRRPLRWGYRMIEMHHKMISGAHL